MVGWGFQYNFYLGACFRDADLVSIDFSVKSSILVILIHLGVSKWLETVRWASD
jgi:hypothetical protein